MQSESNAQSAAPSLYGVFLFVIVATAVLALAFLSRFHGFKIYDDAYMYVRYADHILAGQGMTWNAGEGAVYGASSLAYVLAVIPFRLLFPDNPAAAIFTSSFFWGMLFLGMLFRLALRVMGPSKAQKPFVMGFLMVSLIATAVSLRGHFASGMETTLLLCYLTAAIGMLERLQRADGNTWLTGILLGLAWWLRPELCIFAVGIPAVMVLLLRGDAQRGAWLRVLVLSVAGMGLCLLAARGLTGAWLPASYAARSGNLHGLAYAAPYRWAGFAELTRFLGRSWPAVMVIGMGIFVKWQRLGAGYRPLDKAFFLCMAIFAALFGFWALQIMGAGQRFFYPLFPFMVFLALREMLDLQENLRLGPGFQFKRIPTNIERIGIVVLAALMLYYGIDYGQSFNRSKPGERIAVFDAGRTYHEEYNDYWPRLDRLKDFPNTLRIASTEVGMPAALYPQCIIDDLTGLNTAGILKDGPNAQAVLRHCPADIIYTPIATYERLSAAMSGSETFARQYTLVSAKDLKSAMGVAIRKDSPHATALLAVFTK